MQSKIYQNMKLKSFILYLINIDRKNIYSDIINEFLLFVGGSIERLCQLASSEPLGDRGAVVSAARNLLSAVTRVLLLADIVVVKQLLLAKDKVKAVFFLLFIL